MRSLCMGEIEEDVILPFPTLSDDERETLGAVVNSIDDLLKPLESEFPKWDVAGELPPEFIDKLREFGLFSLVIPEEHGGMAFGSAAYSRTLQQIARHDASVAVTVGAHSSIGMRGLLLFGTEEQRARYMPRLATGELIAAFCLTEPGAGSDAASIKTTAVRDGDHWLLNGNKLWITNGGIADFFTVFAKTGGAENRGKLAAFIVTRDMEGVTTGKHEDKMGIRANSTTSLYLDNVRVPAENLLGPENGGFKVAMNILNSGRSGLGGGCVGAMKALLGRAVAQAKSRKTFGQPISEYGLIRQKLGQMMVDTYCAESVVTMVAGLVDQGYTEYAVEAAISKVYSTEVLWRSADEALQIAAGNGYMREYPYERVLRDARINRIFEGTNEVLRLFIALTAMRDVGEQLQGLSRSLKGAFNHPIKGFGVLSSYAIRRASLATGLRRPKSVFTRLDERLVEDARAFERMTRDLATAVDRVLRKHGKRVIERQFATRRLADIMIDLFVYSCVLSRVDATLRAGDAQGAPGDDAIHPLEILATVRFQVERRVQKHLAAIDHNEDESIKKLAAHALDVDGYPWDVL
ncbi:MAG: acyl-CoA dehydrogenase family protein [Myxococcales bacterium]|nr:acyl-CoA dehydrogenase family protein [Myxococcales bacterium]